VATTGLRPITWAAIAGVFLAVATLVLVLKAALTSFDHTCEVCMTFGGRSQCREAVGKTAEEATRTATDNACALLGARGMSLSIECQNTPPTSVSCRDSAR
jgi:hypothetical protein